MNTNPAKYHNQKQNSTSHVSSGSIVKERTKKGRWGRGQKDEDEEEEEGHEHGGGAEREKESAWWLADPMSLLQ